MTNPPTQAATGQSAADPAGAQRSARPAAAAPPPRSSAAAKRREREIERIVTEFQSDAVEIERGPPPRVALMTTWMLLALFAVGIAYASIAHVDRIVTAGGKLVTTEQQILVQPFETAVIRTIDASVGDIVRKGQRLATLDATFVAADLAQLETQRASFKAQVDRLRAEVDGKAFAAGASSDEQRQATIFQRRRAALDAQVEAADQEIKQVEATILTLRRDIEVLEQRLSVVRQVEGMRKELERTAVGSKLNVLIAENDRLQITRDLDRARNSIVEEQHRLATAKARRAAVIERWKQEAATELVEIGRRYDSVLDQLHKVKRRQELVTLVAPEDAVVLSVAQRSVGSIAKEAEPLMTLVPVNSPLEAEIQIDPSDIGLVKPGLPVQVKIEAFPFQKHGMAKGDLKTISENTIVPESRAEAPRSYYRGRVNLTDINLRDMPENYRLLPGMTLSAEIKLGTRSVLSYFLYPLIRTFDESLREP